MSNKRNIRENDSDDSNDIEMFEFNENSSKQINFNSDFQYEVLDITQITRLMQSCIEQVKTLAELPSATIRTLLKYFKWDAQKLMEELLDGDRNKLFNDAGIVAMNENAPQTGIKRQRRVLKSKKLECRICSLFVPMTDMICMECRHEFCNKCWDSYLTTKVIDHGEVNVITCPQLKCNVIVDDDQVLSLVRRPEVRAKFQKMVANSFVKSNGLLRWCPKPDCLHAFKVQSADASPVKCVCGTEICFACGENTHEPIECELLKAWLMKSVGALNGMDGSTASWIMENTKECPKCHTSIEKNGGCNHITCKSPACKYEWCWICLGPWSIHGTSFYACNKYNDEKAKSNRSKQSDERVHLQRYLFYWTRYMINSQSLTFESQLYGKVTEKMEQLQENYNLSWTEVQFLNKAVDALCKCRQTLMNTYIFAYYCESVPQAMIFEINQNDLHNAVEKLSEFFDHPFAKNQKGCEIQEKVQNMTRYCENRRIVLIQHIVEGQEKEWWKYNIH